MDALNTPALPSSPVLYHGDCRDLLRRTPDESVDLTITSPPYCMGKEYDTSRDLSDFQALQERVLPEIARVTRPGGSICWQVGYYVRRTCVFPLDYIVYQIMAQIPGIILRDRIIWTFGHGPHCVHRFSGRHEMILWFTKGDDYYFDLDAVRVPQKYPGKRHYKGTKKGSYSGNPLGKNPSNVWEIPHVKASHVEKTAHPCQFPVALPMRLIRALCPHPGTVLDPFCGSGTSAVAAVLTDRTFLGAEINADYLQIARSRINRATKGTLRYRSPMQPLRTPNQREAVSKTPKHFLRGTK